MTIEPDIEVFYKVTAPQAAEYDLVIRFYDPDIGIKWPIDKTEIHLSRNDQNAHFLKNIETGFVF